MDACLTVVCWKMVYKMVFDGGVQVSSYHVRMLVPQRGNGWTLLDLHTQDCMAQRPPQPSAGWPPASVIKDKQGQQGALSF